MSYDKVLEQDIFIYLDDLRETGVVNMFEAHLYVAEDFDLRRREAVRYVKKWMQTYESRHKE